MVALCGLLPAAAQEPQQEMEDKAKKMADDAKGMAEKAEKTADDAEAMAEKAEAMTDEAKDKAAAMADDAEKKAEAMADGPSLDEVLESYYEAMGGTDAWASVEAVRFEGTMTMGPGMEAPFTMTMRRPDMIRLDFTFQGMTGTQASDGESTWMVMPFMGKTDPEEMPADMAEQFAEQADIEGPLFGWSDKGHQLELLGAEEMEGTEVYKLKLTHKNGNVRYHYLDSEYYLVLKQEGKTKVQGQELDFETTIGDYKQVCVATSTPVDDDNACEGDALILPYSIESKPKGAPSGQIIAITGVAINPGDIETGHFAKPVEEAAPAEEGAAGG
jgi:hypothetical protein